MVVVLSKCVTSSAGAMEQENRNIKGVSLLQKLQCVVRVTFSVFDTVLFSSSFYFLRFWLGFFFFLWFDFWGRLQ